MAALGYFVHGRRGLIDVGNFSLIRAFVQADDAGRDLGPDVETGDRDVEDEEPGGPERLGL
jgi:hypothetical protein